jgi:hypothetical protein
VRVAAVHHSQYVRQWRSHQLQCPRHVRRFRHRTQRGSPHESNTAHDPGCVAHRRRSVGDVAARSARSNLLFPRDDEYAGPPARAGCAQAPRSGRGPRDVSLGARASARPVFEDRADPADLRRCDDPERDHHLRRCAASVDSAALPPSNAHQSRRRGQPPEASRRNPQRDVRNLPNHGEPWAKGLSRLDGDVADPSARHPAGSPRRARLNQRQQSGFANSRGDHLDTDGGRSGDCRPHSVWRGQPRRPGARRGDGADDHRRADDRIALGSTRDRAAHRQRHLPLAECIWPDDGAEQHQRTTAQSKSSGFHRHRKALQRGRHRRRDEGAKRLRSVAHQFEQRRGRSQRRHLGHQYAPSARRPSPPSG